MRPIRQKLDRFHKIEILDLHDKGKNITACMTAKAVKELLPLIDGKGRRFFSVERAESEVICTFLRQ